MEIGAQFFTIRDFCKTLDDFEESLKKVADIGYKNVQISGVCEYDAEWLSEKLKETELKCVLTHIPEKKLIESPAKVVKDHDIFGCDCVGLGFYEFEGSEQKLDEFANKFLPVADTLKQNGKYFMYHNHNGEFAKISGKTILEHLAERFSPDIMGFALDTYWAQTAGADSAYWIEKLSGRVPCIHLKDHTFDRKMAVIGEGNINFDSVFKAAEKSGTKYMLVEQDDCYGENPFDCLKRSYEFLKSRGFE